jgi:hypothetical protein
VKSENDTIDNKDNRSRDKSTEESFINININNSNISKDNNNNDLNNNDNDNISLGLLSSDKNYNKNDYNFSNRKIWSDINIVIDKKILNNGELILNREEEEDEDEYNINEIYDYHNNQLDEGKKNDSDKSLSYLVSNISNHDISLDYDDL